MGRSQKMSCASGVGVPAGQGMEALRGGGKPGSTRPVLCIRCRTLRLAEVHTSNTELQELKMLLYHDF